LLFAYIHDLGNRAYPLVLLFGNIHDLGNRADPGCTQKVKQEHPGFQRGRPP
jgi:hypothetical protein